jgi:hypothetical protein
MFDKCRSMTALGVLCERSVRIFPSFNEMLECLLTADSSDEVVSDGLMKYFKSLKGSNYQDVEAVLSFIERLLKAINDKKNVKY